MAAVTFAEVPDGVVVDIGGTDHTKLSDGLAVVVRSGATRSTPPGLPVSFDGVTASNVTELP